MQHSPCTVTRVQLTHNVLLMLPCRDARRVKQVYAAVADANINFPGSCGRCYEVKRVVVACCSLAHSCALHTVLLVAVTAI